MLVLVFKNEDTYIGNKEFFLNEKEQKVTLGEETFELSSIVEIIVDGRVIYGDTNEPF
jgi:hypothetical protein